ncbi:MAG: hypothetical protein ACJAV7_002759 [Flavobacteriales bacterium]|jgi:hypothetical protein
MKTLSALFLACAFGLTASAQNFNFSTEQHIDLIMTESSETSDIDFSTLSPQEVTFKWELVSNTMPADWNFSLCDYNDCYIGVPNLGTMITITLEESQNGMEGFFILNTMTGGVAGGGVIELYVYDSSDYTIGEYVSWTVATEGYVSVNEVDAVATLAVYPNPANEQLNIDFDEAFTGFITNNVGQKVMDIRGNQLTSFDVSLLESGLYIISIQSASGNISNKQIVIQ